MADLKKAGGGVGYECYIWNDIFPVTSTPMWFSMVFSPMYIETVERTEGKKKYMKIY